MSWCKPPKQASINRAALSAPFRMSSLGSVPGWPEPRHTLVNISRTSSSSLKPKPFHLSDPASDACFEMADLSVFNHSNFEQMLHDYFREGVFPGKSALPDGPPPVARSRTSEISLSANRRSSRSNVSPSLLHSTAHRPRPRLPVRRVHMQSKEPSSCIPRCQHEDRQP